MMIKNKTNSKNFLSFMNIYNTNNWKKNLCCPMAFAIAFFGMCGISQAAIPVAVNDSAGASIQGSNFTFDGGEVATDSVQGKSSQLKALLANAQSCLDSKMNADVKQALTKSIADAENILKSSEADSTAISNAYSDLGSKIWAAQLSIAVYKEISTFFTKAEKLDEAGHNAFNNYVADIQNAWNDGTITDGEEEISILADKLRVATKVQTTNNSDWTYAIYNPSFEDKGKHWVAMTGYKPLDVLRKDSLAWAYADGERYAYRVNDNDAPVQINYFQDIDSVQIGIYRLKATIYTNSKTVSIYGNELKTVITPCSSTDEAREVEQILVSWNGKRITLGVIGTLQKGEEFRIDNFRLEYLSHDLDIEAEKVPDDVPINKDIRNQQNNAVEQFRDNPQPTTLSAALEAIADAKESARQYQKVRQYLDSVQVFLEKNNVYTIESYTSVMNTLASLENRYVEGTLSDEEIETMQYSMWQKELAGFNDLEASDIDAYKDYPLLYYLFDAWTLTRDDSPSEVVKADGNFRVNTWAKEVTDNTVSETSSKMTAPFIEYRNSSLNGGTLGNATIHAKAIDLEPGLYKMRIQTRVANESGNVAPADFKGITLHVATDRVNENNGMSVLSSDKVDICKGDVCRDGNLDVVSQVFEIDSIIVRSKDNHDVHVYFNIENTNVSWLAWKNCQFTKVRELFVSEEEDDSASNGTPTDTVKVDIAKPQTTEEASNTDAAPEVKKDEKGESVYVYKPADENKDQTITLVIPLDVIVAGTTYKIIIDLYPVFEAYARPNYLTFGLKGNGSKIYERSSADLYALGKYVYANDKEMKLEYEFTATQDMQSPVFVIKTETPVDAEDESTRSVGLKGISLVSETSSTAIETTRTETEVIPISIYNISGVNISSFQKGINVVRFSDGSVKKVFR